MPEPPSQTVLIEHAGVNISVFVTFRVRERLSIIVHPNGTVSALAPSGRSLQDVVAHLHRRRFWIAKQRRHFEQYQPLPIEKRWVSGETHLYLGRQYRLRVHQSAETSVRLIGRYFEVETSAPKNPLSIAFAMRKWYQSHAETLFRERLHYCIQTYSSLRVEGDVKLRVKPLERRWGSCSKAGMITLNTDLVKTPSHCIDYVIIHELCHLLIHNHSPAFFRLLERCIPDWTIRKERLDKFVLR